MRTTGDFTGIIDCASSGGHTSTLLGLNRLTGHGGGGTTTRGCCRGMIARCPSDAATGATSGRLGSL